LYINLCLGDQIHIFEVNIKHPLLPSQSTLPSRNVFVEANQIRI